MDFMKKMMSTVRASVGGGGMAPNFPYELDELLLPPSETGGLWAIHAGHAVRLEGPDDKVTIFVAEVSRRPNILAAMRNAVKRLKTIRHPHVLKFIASVENDTEIIIATERVTPLTARGMLDQLRKSSEGMLWMVNLLLKALSFLNNEAGVVHGNIRTGSIFLTPSGELKLGGFELAASIKEEESLLVDFNRIFNGVSVRDWPPEVSSPSGSLPWRQLKALPVPAIDSFMLAKCLAEVFQGMRVPAEIAAFINSAVDTDPRRRPSAFEFLGKARRLFQDVQIINVAEKVDTLAVMEIGQREEFLTHISQHAAALPSSFLKYKVVPTLVSMFQVPTAQGSVAGIRLLMSCAASLTEVELQRTIVPVLSSLLAKPNRAIRMTLLEFLEPIIDKLDGRVVQETIYPQIISGFTDGSPALREQTLKTSLILASKLSSRQLNGELLRFYARLQGDEQPGIRVNTTVCLGRIASLLDPATRQRILGAAFVRALRDPFVPARAAGLAVVQTAVDLLSPEEMAKSVLPTIVTLLVDPDRGVRSAAFKATGLFVKRLESHSVTIPSPPPIISVPQSPVQSGGSGPIASSWGIGSLADKLMGTAIGENITTGPTEAASDVGAVRHTIHGLPNATERRSSIKPKQTGPARTIQSRAIIPPNESTFKPETDGWDAASDELGLDLPDDIPEAAYEEPVSSPMWQDDDNPWSNQVAITPIDDSRTQSQYSPANTTNVSNRVNASKPMVLGRKKQQDLLDL
jgi:SCY1-like protein 1